MIDWEGALLMGKTLASIENTGSEIRMITDDGKKYHLYHEQDCCEVVRVEDVIGDLEDLVGSPITMVERAVSSTDPEVGNISRACSSNMLAGDFFWKKVGDSAPEKIETSSYFLNRMHDGNKPRPVLVHTVDSTQKFESIKSASEHTGIYPSTIIRGCKNCKVYGGFRFEYENK